MYEILLSFESNAMSNYAYVPMEWHAFAGTDPTKKMNLTRFHKMIYDRIDTHHLTYTITMNGRHIELDDELCAILKVKTLRVEKIQDHVAFLVSLVVRAGDHYLFVQDALARYGPGREHMTTDEFVRDTKIQITKYLDGSHLDDNDDDEDDDVDYDDNDDDDYSVNRGEIGRILQNIEKYIPFCSIPVHGCGFASPCRISENLQIFLDVTTDECARTTVTQKVIEYIKQHELEDPNNRRYIIPDAKLLTIVGDGPTRLQRMQKRKDALLQRLLDDPTNERIRKRAEMVNVTDRLSYFNIQVHLNDCFPKWTPVRGLRRFEHWAAIFDEMNEKFDLPPMVDERPIFKKGGIGYWNGWNAVQELD